MLKGRRVQFYTLQKVGKTQRLCRSCKKMTYEDKRRTFEEGLQRCILRERRSASPEMLGGQGADFLRGVAFWNISSSGLWRWLCLTGAAFPMTSSFSVAFKQMECQNRNRHWYEAVSSALQFPFLKEVWQNCFVFDIFEEVSQSFFVLVLVFGPFNHFWKLPFRQIGS